MGKYIRKGKITGGGVTVMEVSHHHRHHQPSIGVRTRARTKTLAALQRLRDSTNSAPPPPPLSSSSSSDSSSCYLQLRSRRLHKCLIAKAAKPNPNSRSSKKSEEREEGKSENGDAGVEVSFGENVLEVEGKSSRNSRETTPCSQIMRDSETIGTPGSTSTTRRTNRADTNRRIQRSMPRNVPTSREMEEFFAVPEQCQQKEFAEKYNFDPVKDHPLPGRYEWVKLEN